MIAPRRNNASGDLEHHLTQIDEYGITVVSDVLSPAELHMLPDLVDRVCEIRELHAMSTNHSDRRRRTLACFYTQAGLPRMCDQRFYLSPEVQRQASPQARVLLGLDSPEPLSAGGRFYTDGNLPQAPILGK